MNEIILTSSVLILVIVALRRLFRGKISPTLQYALWLLVALRLLIPGTLFTAPVTILGFAEELHSSFADPETVESPTTPQPSTPVYVPGQTITITPAPAPQPSTPSAGIPSAPPVSGTPAPQADPIEWRAVIWKSGIVTVGAAFFISNLVFYCKLRRRRQRMEPAVLPVSCPVAVYYVKDLSSPCLFASAIYVNEVAIHAGRLRHVLTHELTHRRHGDQIWALLRCVCLAIHWYNPLVWWAAVLSRRDCELSCDSSALRRLGDKERIRYGETLMAMLTTSASNLLHAATTMSAGKRTMAERLKLIVHRPKIAKLAVTAVALVTIGAVVLTFGGCAEKADDSEQDPTVTLSNDTDRSEIKNQPYEDADKLTPPDGGFGFVPSYRSYIHPSELFTLRLPYNSPASRMETEDGISFFAPGTNNSEDSWILSVHPQPADWNSSENETIILSSFDPNGTPQNYILEYSTAYADQYAVLREMIAESFVSFATPELFSRLIHDNYEENIALAVSYLPYLSWRNYREVYGEDALMSLQGALWKFADSGSATWDQYHDMLSMTNDGLDGAYSEGLSAIFEALFLKNSEQFLSVINSVFITDTERARVAAYVKYGLGSQPDEDDSEEVVFNDGEIIQSLSRAYGPTVWSTGSPTDLTLTLTGDWTLEGIKAALLAAVSEHVAGTVLEGDLHHIEIGYSFHFPEEMHDGVILTVPFHAAYVDQDVYTLPSGTAHSPSSRTGELTATIQLVGEGITAPVDDDFARGQALYDLLAQIMVLDNLTVSKAEKGFQLLDIVRDTVAHRLQEAGLSESCRMTSLSNGGYYNPLWCDIGYEQTVEYSISIQYTEGETVYQYTFHNTVTIITTE